MCQRNESSEGEKNQKKNEIKGNYVHVSGKTNQFKK